MYHITKTKSKEKPFSVVLVADNGEVVDSHSLKTKQACWKNIQAKVAEVETDVPTRVFVYAQDDAAKRPLVYLVTHDEYEVANITPMPVYFPGKNPKKKKKSSK